MASDLAREQLWRDRIQECRQSGLSVQIQEKTPSGYNAGEKSFYRT